MADMSKRESGRSRAKRKVNRFIVGIGIGFSSAERQMMHGGAQMVSENKRAFSELSGAADSCRQHGIVDALFKRISARMVVAAEAGRDDSGLLKHPA